MYNDITKKSGLNSKGCIAMHLRLHPRTLVLTAVNINACRGYCWESVIYDHHNYVCWMLEIGETLFVATNNYHNNANSVSIIKHYTVFWLHPF